MNSETRGPLVGMVIGDGHLSQNKNRYMSTSLIVRHCAKQRQYAEYKANLLHKLLGGKRPEVKPFDNSGFPGVKFAKTDSYFRILRSRAYPDGKKRITRQLLEWLTPLGVAIWYMDDGGLGWKKKNGKVHAVDIYFNCHTDKENAEEICRYFSERWILHFLPNLNHGKYRIRGGTHTTRAFSSLFSKFIIPEMAYKIVISNPPSHERPTTLAA